METGTLTAKLNASGKVDLPALEKQLKGILSGYADFKFDYKGTNVWVTCKNETTPLGKVHLFCFNFY